MAVVILFIVIIIIIINTVARTMTGYYVQVAPEA